MKVCSMPGCTNQTFDGHERCLAHSIGAPTPNFNRLPTAVTSPWAKQYRKYYKDVSNIDSIDVYGIHQIFGIDDPSGCIQHASKKLLLSGVRTGGKSKFKDIKEARDTLNRWLELNPETT